MFSIGNCSQNWVGGTDAARNNSSARSSSSRRKGVIRKRQEIKWNWVMREHRTKVSGIHGSDRQPKRLLLCCKQVLRGSYPGFSSLKLWVNNSWLWTTYQNPVKYFCLTRSIQSSSGLSVQRLLQCGHLEVTTEDAPRPEKNHSIRLCHKSHRWRIRKGSQGREI